MRATAWLEYKRETLPHGLQTCEGRDNALSMAYIATATGLFEVFPMRRVSLGYLMAITTRFDATEARDRIFALLELLHASAPQSSASFPLLEPDYQKAEAQVFRDATIFWMKHERSLRIWRNVYHRGSPDLELNSCSSWTPQWYRSFDPTQDFHRLTEKYDACLGTEVSSPLLVEDAPTIDRILPLKGFQQAVISQVGELLSNERSEDLDRIRVVFRDS